MKKVILGIVFIMIFCSILVFAESNITDNNNATTTDQNTSVNPDTNSSDSSNNTVVDDEDDDDDSDDNNNSTEVDDDSNKTFVNKSEKWENKCKNISNRVSGRIKMYEELRDPHLNRFNNIINILEKIINQTEAKGYDATKLKEDLAELITLKEKFKIDYNLFIVKLKATKDFRCGHSEGQFQASLKAAKAQLEVVRKDAEDIKEMIKSIIKDDIKKLREQRKEDAKKRLEEKKRKFEEEKKRIKNITKDIKEKIKDRSSGDQADNSDSNNTEDSRNRSETD